jgi:hypothetical protein
MTELEALKLGKWLSQWTKESSDPKAPYWRNKPGGNLKAILVYYADNKWWSGALESDTAEEAMGKIDNLLINDGWYLESRELND